MSVLEKLSGVEIKPDSRISEADRRFCSVHQQAYDDALTGLEKLRKQWKELVKHQEELIRTVNSQSFEWSRYIDIPGFSSRDILNRLETLPEVFISRIISYFSEQYHVSLDSDPVKKRLLPPRPKYSYDKEQTEQYRKAMRELSLRYEDILEQIFIQLGGRTFTERAIDELKEKCHNAVWNSYRSEAEYEVKGDTIRFTFYACKYKTWVYQPRWSLTDKMQDILIAASHFETGQLESYLPGAFDLLGWGAKETSVFEFPGSKVKQLRMFKNGRVDLKFGSKADASQFAAEYLGLVA